MKSRFLIFAAVAAALGWQLAQARPESAESVAFRPAVDPKPLTAQTEKGLEWLASHQNPDGGWGQGEESAQMGGGVNLAYQSNVADTAVACLALLRAGNTPREGRYHEQLERGVKYVCAQVEQSDPDSILVGSVRGTRVQAKLGPTIDTFMANLMLVEVKDNMPDAESRQQVASAVEKILRKIEKNQKADGTYTSEGWAPVLAQSMATKSLNRAEQSGFQVKDEVLDRSQKVATGQVNAPASSAGNAGVPLYAAGAGLTNAQDALNTLESKEEQLKQDAAGGDQVAQGKLKRLNEARQARSEADRSVVARLDDKSFIAGFGSNGGEEFLSYLNISESLVVKGGAEWEKWDRSMSDNMSKIQNPDGSWSGHHCITGRTFCTASALLVLTADRAPVPIAHKVR